MQQSICEIRRNSSVISINSTFKNKLFLTSVIHLTYLTHVILSTHFSNLATSPFHSQWIRESKLKRRGEHTWQSFSQDTSQTQEPSLEQLWMICAHSCRLLLCLFAASPLLGDLAWCECLLFHLRNRGKKNVKQNMLKSHYH